MKNEEKLPEKKNSFVGPIQNSSYDAQRPKLFRTCY